MLPPWVRTHLIAHEQHRSPLRQKKNGEEIADLALTQSFNSEIISRPLRTAIPTIVLVVAVLIAFAIGFVVLVVVGDQIIEGEAVMGGDEVNAAHGIPVELGEGVKAAANDIAQITDHAGVALDEAAHRVPEATVPHRPAVADERTDLVETGSIPGFGNDLGTGQNGVRVDIPQ